MLTYFRHTCLSRTVQEKRNVDYFQFITETASIIRVHTMFDRVGSITVKSVNMSYLNSNV